jgi:hypothetical protein
MIHQGTTKAQNIMTSESRLITLEDRLLNSKAVRNTVDVTSKTIRERGKMVSDQESWDSQISRVDPQKYQFIFLMDQRHLAKEKEYYNWKKCSPPPINHNGPNLRRCGCQYAQFLLLSRTMTHRLFTETRLSELIQEHILSAHSGLQLVNLKQASRTRRK